MSKISDTPSRPPRSRWTSLFFGVVLGFVWGSVMWGLTTVFGQDTGGAKGWLYIAVSMAMIGGGVAAVFGAAGAKKRGERMGPRLRRRS